MEVMPPPAHTKGNGSEELPGIVEAPLDLDALYVEAVDLDAMSFSRTWLIEGLIEQGRVYEVFGKWKQGKTIAVMDAMAHVCLGLPWCRSRTVQSLVVYVAGEAVEDIKLRLAAWRLHHSVNDAMPFVIRTRPAQIAVEEYAARLTFEIKELSHRYAGLPIILVLDTLAHNLGAGINENDAQGMGAFVNNLIDLVARPTHATPLVVHHTGHGDTERSRGHSCFAAAIDGSIKVSLDKDTGQPMVTVKPMFARNTADGDSLVFRIETQELPGADNFGNVIEAPILRHMESLSGKVRLTGKNQLGAVEVLETMLCERSNNLEAGGYDPADARVSEIDFREQLGKAGFLGKNPNHYRKRYPEIRAALIGSGEVFVEGGFLRFCEN